MKRTHVSGSTVVQRNKVPEGVRSPSPYIRYSENFLGRNGRVDQVTERLRPKVVHQIDAEIPVYKALVEPPDLVQCCVNAPIVV